MLPQDKRWAIGITIAIAFFFIMVILAGRAYLTDLDSAYFLTHTDGDIEAQMTLWMLRDDSKNIPIQVNPPITEGASYAQGKIYLQQEYIAKESKVTLQLRTSKPVLVTQGDPADLKLEIEVWHAKVPSHRAVIVMGANQSSAKTTEIYLDDLEPSRIAADTIDLGAYSPRFRHSIFEFSGENGYWEIRVFDSIEGGYQTYNGMALFRLKVKVVVGLDDGSEVSTDWMETQYFAIDLVEAPD